jgi:hypothetical protein
MAQEGILPTRAVLCFRKTDGAFINAATGRNLDADFPARGDLASNRRPTEEVPRTAELEIADVHRERVRAAVGDIQAGHVQRVVVVGKIPSARPFIHLAIESAHRVGHEPKRSVDTAAEPHLKMKTCPGLTGLVDEVEAAIRAILGRKRVPRVSGLIARQQEPFVEIRELNPRSRATRDSDYTRAREENLSDPMRSHGVLPFTVAGSVAEAGNKLNVKPSTRRVEMVLNEMRDPARCCGESCRHQAQAYSAAGGR